MAPRGDGVAAEQTCKSSAPTPEAVVASSTLAWTAKSRGRPFSGTGCRGIQRPSSRQHSNKNERSNEGYVSPYVNWVTTLYGWSAMFRTSRSSLSLAGLGIAVGFVGLACGPTAPFVPPIVTVVSLERQTPTETPEAVDTPIPTRTASRTPLPSGTRASGTASGYLAARAIPVDFTTRSR